MCKHVFMVTPVVAVVEFFLMRFAFRRHYIYRELRAQEFVDAGVMADADFLAFVSALGAVLFGMFFVVLLVACVALIVDKEAGR